MHSLYYDVFRKIEVLLNHHRSINALLGFAFGLMFCNLFPVIEAIIGYHEHLLQSAYFVLPKQNENRNGKAGGDDLIFNADKDGEENCFNLIRSQPTVPVGVLGNQVPVQNLFDQDRPPNGDPPPDCDPCSLSTVERPRFLWPAKGRIIKGFSSGGNDGINIALKEGAIIKAAAGGEVAYAGADLKIYGNMILIRHENGYVTAYAHNKDLLVQRGHNVGRGQTIARSGHTGHVKTSQLHFELRKGQTPLDPRIFLNVR